MIQNLFGVNITEDADSPGFAGDVFVTRQTDPGQTAELEDFCEQFAQQEKKAGLPLPAEIVKTICWFGWVVILLCAVTGGDLSAGYRNAPWLYWLCVICFVLWLWLFILGKRRQKQAAEAAGTQELNDQAEALLRQAREALGVPESAADLDVLAERFVMKDGKPKHKSLDGFNDYLNLDLYAYVQDGSLLLASTEEVWEIPCSSLRTMKRLKKRCSFADWHKSEPYHSGRYRQFKITANQFGTLFAHCRQIEIADARGDFYLLIPDYEAETFTALTGLHPETSEL